MRAINERKEIKQIIHNSTNSKIGSLQGEETPHTKAQRWEDTRRDPVSLGYRGYQGRMEPSHGAELSTKRPESPYREPKWVKMLPEREVENNSPPHCFRPHLSLRVRLFSALASSSLFLCIY